MFRKILFSMLGIFLFFCSGSFAQEVKIDSVKPIVSQEEAIDIAKKVLVKEENSKGEKYNFSKDEIVATFSPTGNYYNSTDVYEHLRDKKPLPENNNGYWHVLFRTKGSSLGGCVVKVDSKTGENGGVEWLK